MSNHFPPHHPPLLLQVPPQIAKKLELQLDQEDSDDKEPFEIKVEGSSKIPEYCSFIIGEETFPAMIVNNPTILEAHKTYDNKVLYKGADIGQVLYVFLSERERDESKQNLIKTDHDITFPNGITPPTRNIVQERFENTKKSKKQPVNRIAKELELMRMSLDAKFQLSKEYIEQIDEVVNCEEWMVDSNGKGISIEISTEDFSSTCAAIDLFIQHPDLFMDQFDLSEEKLNEELERLKIENQFLSNSKDNIGETAVDIDAVREDSAIDGSENESSSDSDNDSDEFDIFEELNKTKQKEEQEEQEEPDDQEEQDGLDWLNIDVDS